MPVLGRRTILSAVCVLVLVVSATLGYYLMGRGEWSFIDCLYFTVYTLATVGCGELFDFSNRPWARALIVLGETDSVLAVRATL